MSKVLSYKCIYCKKSIKPASYPRHLKLEENKYKKLIDKSTTYRKYASAGKIKSYGLVVDAKTADAKMMILPENFKDVVSENVILKDQNDR